MAAPMGHSLLHRAVKLSRISSLLQFKSPAAYHGISSQYTRKYYTGVRYSSDRGSARNGVPTSDSLASRGSLSQYMYTHPQAGLLTLVPARGVLPPCTQARGVLPPCTPARGFRSRPSGEPSSDGTDVDELIRQVKEQKSRGQEPQPLDPAEDVHGWIMRLANENGYLSWCRNAYIATVVSVTAHIQEPMIPYAKEVSILFLLIGSFNILAGSTSFLHYTTSLRRRLHMSRVSFLCHVTLVLAHLALYLTAAMLYMGYVEEEHHVDEILVIEREDSGNKKK